MQILDDRVPARNFEWGNIPAMTAVAAHPVDRPVAILATMVFGVIGSIVFLLLPILIGAFTEELGLGTTQVGWLGSADMIGMFAAAVVATAWIRRSDWRRAGFIAGLALLACHVLSGWVVHYPSLFVIRMVAGFAGGSMMSIALTCLGDGRNPDRYFALFISGQLGLGAIGLALLPKVLAAFGLGGAFLALALLVAIATAAIPFIPRSGRFPAPENLRAIPLKRMIPGGVALLACFLFDLGVMMVWAYAERMGDAAGLEPGFIGNALAGSLLAALAGSLLAAAMGARFGRVLPLFVTLVLQAVALWLLGGELTQRGFFAGVMLFAFAWNFPVAFQLAITVSVDVSGRLVVLFLSAVKLGYAAAPALAALLIAGSGNFRPVLVVAAAVFGVSAMTFALLARRGRPNPVKV